jgi:hypothetical protein
LPRVRFLSFAIGPNHIALLGTPATARCLRLRQDQSPLKLEGVA